MRFLIVIPTHNEEENILRCLDSLRKQSFQDFSCIVVNDGSTDNTKVLVEDFIENIRLSGVEFLDLRFVICLNLSISPERK